MSSSTDSLSLRTLSPELRLMIFHLTLKMRRKNNKQITPPLLIALRGDPRLYEEALEIFYKINTFEITKKNIDGFESSLNLGIIERVRCVEFDYSTFSSSLATLQLLTNPTRRIFSLNSLSLLTITDFSLANAALDLKFLKLCKINYEELEEWDIRADVEEGMKESIEIALGEEIVVEVSYLEAEMELVRVFLEWLGEVMSGGGY